MQETIQDTQPLLVTVSQVAKMLSLSRTMIYKLIDMEAYPLCALGVLCECRLDHCSNG